ncbi:MAG: hypothetical protein KIT80_04490 [Chitinophagaceae bacterium]|nr:hypothetical protein [Chitinophagaceae bacterium]MCW5926149.1 hypothetical protein [Chitinophagaceae bacterium]
MSKYFFINVSTDLKIVGHYPQVEHISHECHLSLSTPRSLKKIVSWKFPDEPPFLDYLILHKKATLTDVLSFGMISTQGFLVSERFKNLLEQFNIISHKFYLAKVEYKGTFFTYYFLHLVSNNFDIIDFEKSTFYISVIDLKKIDDITIIDKSDFLIKKDELLKQSKSIRVQRLFFIEQFYKKPMDMFYLPGLHFNIFISKKLKAGITATDISGLNIQEQIIIV